MKQHALILCTGNSARSQMAEGLLRTLAGDRFEVFSAGSKPSSVNPLAIAAMDERGIDIRSQRSKHLNEYLDQPFDYVITVCDNAAETCPLFPGPARRIHWSFPDPAAAGVWQDHWVYWLGPLLGAALGASLYQFLRAPLARQSASAQQPQDEPATPAQAQPGA